MNYKEIVIFAGTTEGRLLSEGLSRNGIYHTVCVATSYGEMLIEDKVYANVCDGRMDLEAMRAFIDESVSIVVDATHPYATTVTANIREAASNKNVKYIRVLRADAITNTYESEDKKNSSHNVNEHNTGSINDRIKEDSDETTCINGKAFLYEYNNMTECVNALTSTKGNILLTTGSKELSDLRDISDKSRIYVRVIPSIESLTLCENSGIRRDHIIAMHGPFTKELNKAIIRQYDIKHLVTKQSGTKGGYYEKIDAATEEGVIVYAIKKPIEKDGVSISEALSTIVSFVKSNSLEVSKRKGEADIRIDLIGIGMGYKDGLTIEARKHIDAAEVVFGAKRLLTVADNKVTYPYYLAKDILPVIKEKNITKVVVLFSGDTGFYSGAKAFTKYINESKETWTSNIKISTYAGISSVSYLSSCINVLYSDAMIISLHGKDDDNSINGSARSVLENEVSFIIFSSNKDLKKLALAIIDKKKIYDDICEDYIKCYVGRNLSYEDEYIECMSLEEVTTIDEAGLYTVCFVNEAVKVNLLCDNNTDNYVNQEENTEAVSNVNRVLIAAAGSGSGKTIITCGLLNIFKQDGRNVTGYKCGPDYIDPMFHRSVIGVGGGNLDTCFCNGRQIRQIIATSGYDTAVIEGVMGIYDGLGGDRLKGSCYDVAIKSRTPIILVVDAKGQGQTVAAIIKGILSNDRYNLIKGIILNRMSTGFYNKILSFLEDELASYRPDVTILGHIPKLKDATIGSRHLGLLMPNEIADIKERIDEVSNAIRQNCDLAKLSVIMQQAGKIIAKMPEHNEKQDKSDNSVTDNDSKLNKLRLAVAMDEAFCFYYQENLSLFEEMSVEMVPFSPLNDDRLPDNIDGLLIGGGYPENYLKRLEANQSMRKSIQEAIKNGLPYLAECGGFMYLHDSIRSATGNEYKMCGVISGECYKTDSLKRFGYVEVSDCMDDNMQSLSNALIGMKGHEFHYYESNNNGENLDITKLGDSLCYKACHVSDNGVAGFMHMYYRTKPEFIEGFVARMKNGREKV